MRMLEYTQELFGQGYTVVGSDVHYECLLNKRCNPLRMINILDRNPNTEFVENLVDAVEIDWDESETRFFYTNYADIIRGKYPEWQLVAFHVRVGTLCLDYHNYKTDEHGFCHLSDSELGFDVQFEVPRSDGGPETRYLVSIGAGVISKNQYTYVTEFASHMRREISFRFKDPNRTDPFCDVQCIDVTEYADL